MPDPASPTAAQRLRVLHVIWLAQIASVVLFVAVCVLVSGRGAPVDPGVTGRLRPVVWALAFGLAAASIWLRRSFVGAPILPNTEPSARACARLQARCVIVWAMSEAVGVLGLVLGILTRDVGALLPFAGASVALLYVHRPAAWWIAALPRT